MNTKLELSAPWVNFYREIDELFKSDHEINVVYDEEYATIRLDVDNTDKAVALRQLLPHERMFGDVTVRLQVIPATVFDDNTPVLFERAFKGNPVFKGIKTRQGANPFTYVMFQKKVVQYFNDNLGDVSGMRSTLYQDIAKDVFEAQDGVFFCTAPLEETCWN